MMTRKEVLEIDAYCHEHKVSYRQLGTGGGFVPTMPPPRSSRSGSKAKQTEVSAESYVTVELRTPNGTAATDAFFTNAEAETAKSNFIVNDVTGKYRTLSKSDELDRAIQVYFSIISLWAR